MSPRFSRRRLFTGLGVSITASFLPSRAFARLGLLYPWGFSFFQRSEELRQREVSPDLLYRPVDLSYFEKPIRDPADAIKFSYAAITWGGNDRQAIEDIAAVGFHGIQLRSNVVEEFDNKPAALRALLAKNGLTMVALSSGGLSIDRRESDELAKHERNAQFLRDAGGKYLQVTDDRPKDREITKKDYDRLGDLPTKLGKRTSDLGIALGYHNHMGSLGERPEGVDWILEASDPRYVKLELDVAHYFLGGGNPVEAIDRYNERLLFSHIKDGRSLPTTSEDSTGKRPYQFVELGHGQVDLPGVFDALKRVKFHGWAVVELDSVPDKSRTPKESALISKSYLEQKLGYRI